MTVWSEQGSNQWGGGDDGDERRVGMPILPEKKQMQFQEPRYFEADALPSNPLSRELNMAGCKSPRSHKVDVHTDKVICDGAAQRLCYFYRLVRKSNLGASQDSCPAGIADSAFVEIGERIK